MDKPEQYILALQALSATDKPMFIDDVDEAMRKDMDILSGVKGAEFQDLETLAAIHEALSTNEDPTIRRFGAGCIAILASNDLALAEKYIERYASDADVTVRAEFAEFAVFGVYTVDHGRAAELFKQLLTDSSELVRSAASEGLADLGGPTEFDPPSLGIGIVATYQAAKES